MTDRVLLNIDADGNATVALNRPDVHNAFDPAMAKRLTATLKKLEQDPKVRAVVLTGVGKNFSSGADIGHMKASAKFSRAQNEAAAREMAEMFLTLYALQKPTVAAVRGAVRGGGAGLVAACDIAIGTRDTTFRLTEVRLGILPAMISPYVVAAIGARQAHRYFLTGEEIDAAEAWRIGLLHDICEDTDLGTRVGGIVHELYQGGPAALLAAKQVIREVHGRAITPAVVEATAKNIAAIRATREAQEGLAAFLEKRRAAWTVPASEKKKKRK
jgi:methylglutaconyl-CoA hydratase